MKILSIAIGIPPKDLSENSSWIRIIKNADILHSSGNDVEFLFYVWKLNSNLNMNIPFKYSIVEVFRNPLSHLKHIVKIKKHKYNIIYFNIHIPLFYLFINSFKTPVILDRHGDNIYEFLLSDNSRFSFVYFFRKIANFVDVKYSDKIICVSHKMIEDLCRRGINKNKLFYITNGVDLNYFKELSNHEIDLDVQNKLVFSYIGAFDKWQGIDNFIKAAAQLKNDSNILFLIVGGEKEAKDGNILYIPKVPHKEVLNYYSISDIFVLPRPSHPATEVAAPTKFAEYAAMGKPILTTDVGDASYFVKKYNCGIVINNNDPTNLINGIIAFKNKTKNELINMGINSRKLAENEFNWIKMSKEFMKIIK